jgi:hypothetical protein
MGFQQLEDLSSDRINARYFSGRSDELRVRGSMGRLMCARG